MIVTSGLVLGSILVLNNKLTWNCSVSRTLVPSADVVRHAVEGINWLFRSCQAKPMCCIKLSWETTVRQQQPACQYLLIRQGEVVESVLCKTK